MHLILISEVTSVIIYTVKCGLTLQKLSWKSNNCQCMCYLRLGGNMVTNEDKPALIPTLYLTTFFLRAAFHCILKQSSQILHLKIDPSFGHYAQFQFLVLETCDASISVSFPAAVIWVRFSLFHAEWMGFAEMWMEGVKWPFLQTMGVVARGRKVNEFKSLE